MSELDNLSYLPVNNLAQVKMERVRHVHFVGVGGCGMSAIAKILFAKGFTVSGSDLKESSNTIRLKDLGVAVYIGHQRGNIRGADLLVLSSAIPSDNLEEQEAKLHGINICRRAEMLSWIMDQFSVRIAVAGTHGKTTTTSMLAQVWLSQGLDPTFLIGGETDSVEGNARLGSSPYIVAEADESDGSFLILNPNLAVVTNIEDDHLDHFGALDAVKRAFKAFAEKLGEKGKLVINVDEKNAAELSRELKSSPAVYTYGLSEAAELRAQAVNFLPGSSTFRVSLKGEELGEVKLLVPGWQNILNSLAVVYVGLLNNLDFNAIASSLHSFRGAKRRFQLIGEVGGIKIFDDYAHHPTEIKLTLQGARLNYPEARVICVFQPHRFSRTLHLYKKFGEAFGGADLVIVTDIYGAGEKPIEGISGQIIVDEIQKAGRPVIYLPRKEKIAEYLLAEMRPGDLVLLAGAGDIYTVAKELFSRLRIRENADTTP